MVGTGKVPSIVSTATPAFEDAIPLKRRDLWIIPIRLKFFFFRRRVFFHVDTSMYKSDQIFLSDSFYVIKYLLALK